MGTAVTLSWACILLISGCDAFSIAKTENFRSIMLLQSKSRVASCTRMLPSMSVGNADEERELTNEECEILNLPYGTKLIGEMSDRYLYFHHLAEFGRPEFSTTSSVLTSFHFSMKLRLDKQKQGTYEKTNGLRYFGNEKFRKENYFGKQKLQVLGSAS